MATRKPTPKRRTTQPAAKRQPPRRRAGGKGSAQRPAMPQFALSPNLQREIFAVVLICLGLLTLVFSTFGGDQGAIGSRWNATVMQAFGTGRVLVPVALGILGGLIIFQEHFSDSRLTGANVVGTVMVLLALLVLLEFPAFDSHRTQEVIPVGEGGGVVGNVVLSILVSAIGKAGAMLLSLTIGIIGIMLTFNLTIRQIMSSVIYYSGSVRGIGRRLLGAPVERYPEPPARPLDPRELMLAESRQAPAAA
ncbi:MAG TPA: DNA translocase FtsK 4TM domain-containing protein, partial [Herpetosiphonaceae bacterium]